jgi:hypothetical protein
MSMFDYFQPASQLHCPVCQRALREWQGKDGPCGLLIWAQGVPGPIGQAVPEEVRVDQADLQRKRLPSSFAIYSYDCPEHQPIEADCLAEEGVWVSTKLRPYAPR